MARKYLVHYPNGMKRHVNRLELGILGSSLTQIGAHEYRATSFQSELNGQRYLPGKFIVEFIDKFGSRGIRTERLETVLAMIARLIRQGVLAT